MQATVNVTDKPDSMYPPPMCGDYTPLYEDAYVPDPEDYRDDFRNAWFEYCSECGDGNFLSD